MMHHAEGLGHAKRGAARRSVSVVVDLPVRDTAFGGRERSDGRMRDSIP